MRKVEYICNKCNHIKLEDNTWKVKGTKIFAYTVLVTITLLAAISGVGILNMYNYTGLEDKGGFSDYVGWTICTSYNNEATILSFMLNDYISNKTYGLVKDCNDDECKAKKLFEYVDSFEYEEGYRVDPKTIIENETGDCDGLSLTLAMLLRSYDIKAIVECNENHAWNIIKVNNRTIKVDTTGGLWEEIG